MPKEDTIDHDEPKGSQMLQPNPFERVHAPTYLTPTEPYDRLPQKQIAAGQDHGKAVSPQK